MARVNYPQMIEDQRRVIAQLQDELRTAHQSRQQFAEEHNRSVGIVTNLKAAAEQLQRENAHIAAQAHAILKWSVFENGGEIVLCEKNMPRIAEYVLEREDRGEGRDAKRVYTLRDLTPEEKALLEEARDESGPIEEEAKADGQEG